MLIKITDQGEVRGLGYLILATTRVLPPVSKLNQSKKKGSRGEQGGRSGTSARGGRGRSEKGGCAGTSARGGGGGGKKTPTQAGQGKGGRKAKVVEQVVEKDKADDLDEFLQDSSQEESSASSE
ncbi:glycine-rich RNA-binding protein 8-like [Papaver somniferum]|uniref:glycine-rich RNA-binding protein 8-like n=1 Tax=Papaver somniferum TaxID=3469 RepID=UPI000E70369D|nr:glycine-rich RNA-binding protein 8-like [Papaver somniferum]